MTNKCFFWMNAHVPCQMTLLTETQSTYLTKAHPCLWRPHCSSSHGGMRLPILPPLYLVEDELISCKGCQVGGRVHYKLVVGKDSVQRRQPNACIHNKTTRFHCVFVKQVNWWVCVSSHAQCEVKHFVWRAPLWHLHINTVLLYPLSGLMSHIIVDR